MKILVGAVVPAGIQATLFLPIVLIAIAVIVLVLLDVWSTVEYWIDSKRKELYIRKLCGATNGSLCGGLIRHFSALMVLAFGMALILYEIIHRSSFFAIQDIQIAFSEMTAIFFILLIFGNLLNLFEIRKIWKKSMTELKLSGIS